MRKFIALSVLCVFQAFFLASGIYGQEKKESDKKENVFLHPPKFYKKYFPHLKVKKTPVDTLYIKTYPNYLSTAAHILVPEIYLDLNPIGRKALNHHALSKFRTNVNTIVAFTGSYRFVTVGFAIALKSSIQNKEGYANTSYRTATIKYNNPIYSLQFKFIKMKGFTDINQLNNQDSTRKYLTRQDIIMKEYHFEGIYNLSWKKYAYMAPIDFTQRQVKSRIGFMIKAGVYYNELYSDTNLLSVRQRDYFEGFTNINIMKSYSLKFAPGIGGNLLFKRKIYLAASVFVPYNLYLNKLYTPGNQRTRSETSLQLVLDGMVSIGYQSKQFYTSIRCQLESKRAKLKYFSSTMFNSYIGIDVGYRFNTPGFVKKFYKKTMPPGM
jgi:hypothetical protein